MSAVIAERELTVDRGDGEQTGFVRIFAPVRDEKYNAWRCHYHIAWPGFERKFSLVGVDSYQALTGVLRIIPVEIQVTEDFKAGRLKLFSSPMNPPAHPLLELTEYFGLRPMEASEPPKT